MDMAISNLAISNLAIRNREISEIVDGLSADQKQISPKYFYDERGSQLFDDITQLPEYYLTNTELGIMRDNIAEITASVGKQASLIEFGSGSSLKTRILLEHLSELAAYVPVDISSEHLHASAQQIRDQFPHVDVLPVVADFTRTFSLPKPMVMPVRNIIYFSGSTIGNFEHDMAMELLRVMYQEAGAGGALLIGIDLQKDPNVIENAYNDSAGITAEFNLNMLQHLNRDYGANFDINEFAHSANYDENEGRVVIELISQTDQTFEVGDTAFDIADGEAILTEYSHKYTLEGFAAMANATGFTVDNVWTDAEQLFSVQFLTRQ
jgi:dimethylhistidine N-methyltransferase